MPYERMRLRCWSRRRICPEAKAEFDALKTAAPGFWTPESSVNGYKFTETSSSNTIFLPAAGYGDGTGLGDVGVGGYYWSSSLFSNYPDFAYFLYFCIGDAYPGLHYRFNGRAVRALSE